MRDISYFTHQSFSNWFNTAIEHKHKQPEYYKVEYIFIDLNEKKKMYETNR